MKITDLLNLQESVTTILDTIDGGAEDQQHRQANANYLATLMVLRDMDLRYKDEAHPLKSNTLLDYLYSEGKTTRRALEAFHARIQENPRARNLMKKYVEQFMDHAYGGTVMRNRIKVLRDHFNKRKDERIKHHEDTVVKNFNTAQDKFRADYQQDITKND